MAIDKGFLWLGEIQSSSELPNRLDNARPSGIAFGAPIGGPEKEHGQPGLGVYQF